MKLRFAIAISALFCGSLAASAKTAIGTFVRRQKTPSSREIILRFPILLSKAYQRAQRGRVMYPNEFDRLREENKIPAKVLYTPEEYATIAKFIDEGALLTGEIYEYNPEDENEDEDDDDTTAQIEEMRVFVRLHHYNTKTKKLVSLNVDSTPENVVADLVRHILPLEEDRYLMRPIAAKSRITVIAPLDAPSLNNFLAYLLELQFDVRLAAGSDYTTLVPQELEPLREIQTSTVSYSTVAVQQEPVVPPLSVALDNAAERRDYNHFAALYTQNVAGFSRRLSSILSALRQHSGADYLLILQPYGKKPFARGFDLRRGGLAWFQDSFPAKSSNPGEILASMIAEMQRPAKTLDEAQFAQLAQEKDRMPSQGTSGGLASVAILDFYDRTNSPLYAWLSNSLSTAIDGSMQRIFEYERANEKISSEVGKKVFRSSSDISSRNLKEFQAQTGADYLIFGFYSINPQNGNIVIESKVFDLVKKTAIGGSRTESPVDARLFNVVDQIAQGIVQDIFTMTQKQNQ